MMNEWMKTVLSLSVSGTLLLLLLMGLKRFYQNRFSRRWQYYILLLAALRFLLPVTPGAADASIVGNLFHKFEKSWSTAQAVTGGLPTELGVSVPTTEPGPIASPSANTDNSEITPAGSDRESVSPAKAKPFDVSACLFSIWAATALVIFVRRITVYQGFVQYIRAGSREVSDRRILNLLSNCQETLHVRARVELSCNPLITSPVMIGFFRPNIILPVNEAEDGALSHIFLHELIHYKQKDMFYKWLIQTVICLHWFNPFVYFLGKEVNRACELSCDEKVLSLLDEKARRGYGDMLLSFFKPDSPYKNSLASVTLTDGAAQLKERLGAIMKYKKKTKSVIAATVILSAALCVCFWEIGAYAASVEGDMFVDSQHSASYTKVIGDGDIANITSEQITTVIRGGDEAYVTSGPETDTSSPDIPKQAADIEDITFDVVKIISDERCLYLLFSIKANDGAFLNPEGYFADFNMFWPGKMMSGAYQHYFLERKDGVPENELEGVIYADWQADANAKKLMLRFSNWQEKMMFDDVKVDFNVSEMVADAGENAELSSLYNWGHDPQYLWQPGDADIKLPYGGASICNAGWENGILQIVMTGPKTVEEWSRSTYHNCYFVDTRTDKIIKLEPSTVYRTPDQLEEIVGNPGYYYFWNFVTVDKEALPYLEMHCGGKESYATVFPGEWEVCIDETPVTIKSKLLTEDVTLYYAGRELHVDKIECSKLSLAVYFTDYVDPTTGILGEFDAFDADGNPIRCNWGFIADGNGNGCMIRTRFAELIDPESICSITFDGETIFMK